MAKKLSTRDSKKLLNYIINENPILKEELSLKVQGKSVQKIGELIMSCERYKNAFINTCNMIALTLIVNDEYENPWEEFTNQGSIQFGQTVREMIMDLVDAKDYNEHMNSTTDFLEQEVPNIYNYFHDLNFQKFYKVTVNDAEISLAFTESNGVFNFIAMVYTKLRTSYNYDRYLVDKYQIQRRLVDGTIPSVEITDFATNEIRDNVAFMKEYSNNMIFMSNKYNPAGLRRATPFSKQRTIISTGFEARLSTNVLATSYYKDEAEMRTKLAMIDGFADNDWSRLSNLLGDAYTEFTQDEIAKLQAVAGMIIADDFFKDFYYKLTEEADSESTEFRNPETLARTMWLHAWRIFSTSPFACCLAFTTTASGVTSVSVSPSTATVTAGQKLQLSAQVETTGITNKSVSWGVDETAAGLGVTINQNGDLFVPSGVESATSITVTATSIFNKTVSGTATITVA
jgi:hypothetical protein